MAKKNFAKLEEKKFNKFSELLHYLIIYFILYPYFKVFYSVKIEGRENIPKDKPVIVAANHLSYYDPLLISLAMNKPVSFMAKEELFYVPVLSFLIRKLNAFAVDRQKLDLSTIKSAKIALKHKKWVLGIFPEGTRVMNNEVGHIHKGFGFLAKATNSEILPLGIIGANSSVFKKQIILKIGKLIPIPETADEAIINWGTSIAELTGFSYDASKYLNEEIETISL